MGDVAYAQDASTAIAPGVDRVLLNDWHVVTSMDSLQPGTVQRAQVLEQDLVVWCGHDGTVQVWEDRCPHRSVRLSRGKVVNNTLVCPYHGMAYNTSGQCIHVPAHSDYVPPKQAHVRQYPVQVQYGLLFVCLGDTPHAIAPFPEWTDAEFVKVMSGPYPCQTGGFRAIENFLDLAHFAHLHSGILGDPEFPQVGDYTVTTDDRGVHFNDIHVWQPDPMNTGKGSFVSYSYSALRPLTAYFHKTTPEGQSLAILYWVTPVSEEVCVGWMWMAFNCIDESQKEAAIAFQDNVFEQDRESLESHHPKRLPLDPTAEFHVPCDRGSLAYRKWLKQLGVTYGVIH